MAEVKLNSPTPSPADLMRQSLPSNSITANRPQPQPEREKVQPVVKGKATLQKETLGAKLKKAFFPSDVKDVKRFAIEQILVPSVKNGALALFELALFGTVSRRPVSGGSGAQRTNYTYISTNGQSAPVQQTISQRDRATHNFQNIMFTTYQDAEDVISTLLDLLDRYGAVRVSDFYDAAGIDCDWAAQDWGWKSFQRLEPRAVHGGYIIDISQPISLR